MTILFLNHDFFEYDKAIKEQLSGMGHNILSYKYVKLPNHLEMMKFGIMDLVTIFIKD